MVEALPVVLKIVLDKGLRTLYMYLMKRNENMKDEQWEAHVDDNGAVYVTDSAGNTLCDLYYVTGRTDRETGNKILHTFPSAEEHVKYVAAIPNILRELVKAKEELLEAADKLNFYHPLVRGPLHRENIREAYKRAVDSGCHITEFLGSLAR